jgi:hypothetical protein
MKNLLSLFCVLSAIVLFNSHCVSCFDWFDFLSGLFESQEPETYRLTYFDIRGRAEFIRWLFAYSQQPFTDDRINMTDWPVLKPTVPFEQVPVLEVNKNGKTLVLAQSLTIGKSRKL